MKNLYEMFKMVPPNQKALGARLLGRANNVPASGVAVKVPLSAAPSAFFQKVGMPMGNVLAPNTYPLGSQGGLAGLRGLGAFGSGGDPALELVPGVYFRAAVDKNDFVGGRAIHQSGIKLLKLSWTPVTQNFVTQVASKMNELNNAGVDMAPIRAEGNRLTKLVFDTGEGKEWEAVFLGARGEIGVRDEPEKTRLNSMRQLKGWMDWVMAQPVPETMYTPPGTPGGFVPVKTPSGGAIVPGSTVAAKPSGGLGSPVLIAGGVAVAGLLAVVVLKKRKGK